MTNNFTELCAELEALWRREIPLTAALGLSVDSFVDEELVVRAALEPNINVHGTAFGGSLYSVCALAGWGAIWIALRARGIDASIVLASAEIDYRLPVAEAIVGRSRFDAVTQAPNLGQLTQTGNGLFPLTAAIDARGKRAVRFVGEFAARLRGVPESDAPGAAGSSAAPTPGTEPDARDSGSEPGARDSGSADPNEAPVVAEPDGADSA